MSMRTKVIGRQPTDHGPYDPQFAYGKKFTVTLFDCGWESKHDNNTSAPATLNAQAGTITENTTDWKKVWGSYKQWLIDNGYQKMDASDVKDGNNTQHDINVTFASEIGNDSTPNSIKGRVTTLEGAVGTGGSVDERIATEGAKHYLKSETYTKDEVNGMITTPDQGFVSVSATSETTAATDVLPATGEADTIYRVANWDGSQYDTSVYSEYSWNTFTNTYIKLSTKQVGIDDEPTPGSDNLVKSGGVLSFVYDLIEETVDDVFTEILVDPSGSILECRDADGKRTIFTDVEIIGKLRNRFIENLIHEVSVEYQETKDFVGISQMLVDTRQRLLEYIDDEGNKILNGNLTVKGEFHNKELDEFIKKTNKKLTQSILNSKVCISDIERFKGSGGILSSYDSNNNLLYCVYICAHQPYGEEHVDTIVLTTFPILQPFKAETVTVVESEFSYEGVTFQRPDCSTICEIGNNTLRIFFTTVQRQKYFYRDYNKTTKTFGDIHVIQYNGNDLDIDVAKDYLDDAGYTTDTDQMVMLTKIIYHDGYHYGMLCFNQANPILFRSNDGCASIDFLSIVPDTCNYESCPCFVNNRLYITTRQGSHFLYYTDNLTTWTPLDIIPNGSVSHQRAKLIEYKGTLYILYSLWHGGGKNQISGIGRDNVRVVSYDGEKVKELLFLQDDNGIVYYDAVIVSDVMYFMFSNSDLYLNEDNSTFDHLPQGKDVEYFVKLLNL